MRRVEVRLLAVVLLTFMVVFVWWNQPYFGARICVVDGLKTTEDFLQEAHSIALERLQTRLAAYRSLEVSEFRLSAIEMERTSQIDEAMGLVRECFSQRAFQYCRYIGPNKDIGLNGQMFVPIPDEQKHQYQYIVSDSILEIGIAPYTDRNTYSFGISVVSEEGSNTVIEALDEIYENSLILADFEICGMGCFCSGW